MSVSFLKHYYSFSKSFTVVLPSISCTDKVDSVGLIINILGHKKLSSLDLNKSTESTSTTVLGKLFQILKISERIAYFLRS